MVETTAARPPTVSVVIPTIGRPSVRRSVESALAQDQPPLEVVVAFDGPAGDRGCVDLPDDDRVRLVATGARAGASGARSLAVRTASGEAIAFMDDDDVWLPAKLRLQGAEYARLRDGGARPVISCRTAVHDESGRELSASPRLLYRTGEDVGDYLFARREMLHSGYGFGSCTIMTERALLGDVPVRPDLRLHEDWDWVLRASRTPGVAVSMLPEVLCTYWQQAAETSASRPPRGWDASQAWGRAAGLSPVALGDFLLCVSAANALAYGERVHALSIARLATRVARPSPRGWATFALQLGLPKGVTARASSAAQSLRPARTAV